MVESIARVERSDQQLSPSSYFVWQVPQKPVVVRISLAVVDRLERDAVESFRSLTSRGSEIGGLLFGDVVPGTPAVVTIEDYGAIPCDYTRGPLYRLSEADMARFERSIEQRGGQGGPPVVGFFRSHTRKGLSLDAEDSAFFQARFRDPHQIALLVRPAATKASVGGIFIWEAGAVNTESSYLEFPFRSAELQLLRAAAEAESHAAAALPAPKPPTRAQIVPIASRREPAPQAPPAPEVAPPRPPEPPPAQPPKQADPQPAPPAAAKPVPAPEAEPERKPAATETPAPVAPAEAPEAFPEPQGSHKWVWAVGAAALLAILATVFLFHGSAPHNRPAPAVQAQQDTSPLSLRVERTAGGLLLTWNRASQAIEGAHQAVLSISDGERHENFDMDIEQLRKGSIVYMPYTQDVSFRMEVAGGGQVKAVSEMVRVLRSSPMPEVEKDKPANADAAGPKLDPTAGADPQQPKWAQPVKAFSTASLASRLRPARPAEILEAPALARGDESAPLTALPVNLGNVVPTPQAPSAPAAPAPAKAAPAPLVTSRLQSAQLLSHRDPVYPALAVKNRVKGAVRVSATIGTNGHVKAVKVLSGPPLLAQSAIDAVMQWVYRPTTLNGVAQESQVEIVLNFMP